MRVTLLKSDKLTLLLAGGDAGVCEGVGSGVLAAGGVLGALAALTSASAHPRAWRGEVRAKESAR